MKRTTIANLKTLALTAACTVVLVWAYAPAHASTTSANHGHHGGGNSGAVGAAPGAFGGSQAAAGQSGNGGRYAFEDAYQPWPQSEMQQYQKPQWTPYDGK